MSSYVTQQKELGRLPRGEHNFLENIVAHQQAALAGSDHFALYERLAWFFAAVCLLNTIIIMLAKYIRRTKDVAVRRARLRELRAPGGIRTAAHWVLVERRFSRSISSS